MDGKLLFKVIKDALKQSEIDFLFEVSKQQIYKENIPCFCLLNHLNSPLAEKIKSLVEKEYGATANYLNDFYMYTDTDNRAQWHIDTELYTFKSCINAWILLSPDQVESPLSIMGEINHSPEIFFHKVSESGLGYEFDNYYSGDYLSKSFADIDQNLVKVPDIELGDILLFNPAYFHKTLTSTIKHNFVIKFVCGEISSLLSKSQVDPYFWPEIDIFNELVKTHTQWDNVLEGIRDSLKTSSGKEALSAGFFPERIDLYKKVLV